VPLTVFTADDHGRTAVVDDHGRTAVVDVTAGSPSPTIVAG
jgi:hypothetical protein